MIRKLLLPAACAALLGGCVSYGYSDDGYYYGRPSVRYYDSYGYPYYYDRYRYGYPYRYGGYGYYGYPYWYYYPRRGHHHGDGHDHDGDDDNDHGHDNDNDGKPPWRRRWADDSGDMLKRRVDPDAPRPGRMATPSRPRAVVERPAPRVTAPRPAAPRVNRPAPRPVRAMPAPRNRPERDIRREREP